MELSPQSLGPVMKEMSFREFSGSETIRQMADLNLDTKLKFVELVNTGGPEIDINEKMETLLHQISVYTIKVIWSLQEITLKKNHHHQKLNKDIQAPIENQEEEMIDSQLLCTF